MPAGQAKDITRVALLLAIIFVAQQFRFQYLTGSIVNSIFITAVFFAGLRGAIALSILSPLLAITQGVMPLVALYPFIVAGNIIFVYVISKLKENIFVALITASFSKALIIGLFSATVLPLQGALIIGLSQLITAGIGSMIFLSIINRIL